MLKPVTLPFLIKVLALALAIPLTGHSATYYVSSSGGNDANDGLSEATAWQTLENINAKQPALVEANSAVLFKRGDIFRGVMKNPKFPEGLTFGAYGAGTSNPVIAGSVEITGWVNNPTLGPNIYEADVSGLPLTENGIEHLFVNGLLMTIARYPNVNSPAEKNWLQVAGVPGSQGTFKIEQDKFKIDENQFKDPNTGELYPRFKANDYWNGATLRTRNYSWTFKVIEVTGYNASDGKIIVKGLGNQLPEWGYFLDNKLTELDHPGEWYYDAGAQKVYLYPQEGANPNDLLVEGSTYDVGISIGKPNTTIENLTFRQFTSIGAKISGKVTIRNCHFEGNTVGVSTWNAGESLITNNTFDHQFKNSIGLGGGIDGVNNTVIEKNQITNTAMYPAYGARSSGIYGGIAISVSGKGYTIRQNTIENTGWNAIYVMSKGHHIVKNNVIRNSLMLLNDGGAISLFSDNNIIEGNFLFDSLGNTDESNGCMNNKNPCNHHHSYGMGIGSENNLKNNLIEKNTIANNPDRGIRLNAFVNTIVRNNIVYNNDTQQIIVQDGKGPSHDNVVEGNIIYPLAPDQIGIEMSGTTNHGTFNKNYYCNPYGKVIIERDGQRYSFAHWQNQFPPNDNQSKWCGINFKEYSFSSTGPNMITNPNIQKNSLTWVENQYYRLKFGVTGKGFGTLRVSINDTQEKTVILKRRSFAYDQSHKEYEMFFLSPVNTTAGKLIFKTTTDGSAAYELDNVTFEPVEVTPIDAKQLSKLLLPEPPESPKTFELQAGETYRLVHIKNGEVIEETVTGSVTVEPFSSAILISLSGAIIDLPSPTNPPSPSNHLLTVQTTGKGSGTITLSPTERSCRVSCEQTYTSGTQVTLSAEPSSGSIFAGWSGACSGTNTPTTITMDKPKNCAAHFDLELPPSSPTPNYTLTLNQNGTGSGTISSNPSGIACGSDCTEEYTQGTAVELTATPIDDKSVFASWSGDCSGNKSSLPVTMDTSKNCTARFELKSSLPPSASPTFYTLTVTKMGNGTVTSNPEGITCGTTCVAKYPIDIKEVFLKATPALGSQFFGFDSDENCSKDGKVILNKSVVSCVANFGTFGIPSPSSTGYALTINKAGSGSGKVTSQPTGIDCGEKCTRNYTDDTVVILTATPASNSLFTGWTGACSSGGTSLSTTVTVDQAINCTANFDLSSSSSPTTSTTLLVTKRGSGSITSDPPGMTCGQTTTCAANYPVGTIVTLLPIATSDSQFIGFGGDPDCMDGEVTLDQSIECTALFESLDSEVVSAQTPTCTKINKTFRGVCNGQGETMEDFTMLKNSSLSNVVVKGTVTNNGGWLANATIDSQATVIGGIATGHILNEGIMANIEFRGKTLIGGELSGTFTNTKGGVVQNVQLAANTKVTGGRVGGNITGAPEAPARLENLIVEFGSELSNVIIGENVQLPNYDVLKEGVKFLNSEAIPFDLELISLLPTLPELSCSPNLTQPPLYDLSKDILPGGAGIINSINELSELTTNGWQLIQDSPHGYLRMITDQGQFAGHSLSIKRALDEPQMQVFELQNTRFITHSGLEIINQPAVQAPCELQAALEKLNLPHLTIQDNGNLKVTMEEEEFWYSARPDLYSIEVADDTTLGLSFPDSPVISGIQRASMVFIDSDGKTREQLFYPTLAIPEALLASAQEVVMEYSGEVSFKLDSQSYRGVVDYLITQSEPSSSNKVQIISLPDINGDQTEDLTLVYPTGDQQIIFAFPADN